MAFFKTEEIPHFQADSLKVNYNTLKQAIVLQLFTAFLFRRISEQILHRHLVVDVVGIAALGEAVGGDQGELFNKNIGLYSKNVTTFMDYIPKKLYLCGAK